MPSALVRRRSVSTLTACAYGGFLGPFTTSSRTKAKQRTCVLPLPVPMLVPSRRVDPCLHNLYLPLCMLACVLLHGCMVVYMSLCPCLYITVLLCANVYVKQSHTHTERRASTQDLIRY